MIVTFSGFSQKTTINPEGVKIVLISVDSLSLGSSESNYANICAAARKKGYTLWPNTISASDLAQDARELIGPSRVSAIIATERPIGDSQHQQFLYCVSMILVNDNGAHYDGPRVELTPFNEHRQPWVYPSTALFLFKLE